MVVIWRSYPEQLVRDPRPQIGEHLSNMEFWGAGGWSIRSVLENYIDEDISGNIEVGLIAQELLETDISFVVKHPIPPAEGDDSDIIPDFQPYFVDYGSIMPYCIQAIKELDEKQTNQYNEIIELKSKVNDLQAENDILRNQT